MLAKDLYRRVRQLLATLAVSRLADHLTSRDDRAAGEAFFAPSKRSLVRYQDLGGLTQSQAAIATGSERSNAVRLHSALGPGATAELRATLRSALHASRPSQPLKQIRGKPSWHARAFWTHQSDGDLPLVD